MCLGGVVVEHASPDRMKRVFDSCLRPCFCSPLNSLSSKVIIFFIIGVKYGLVVPLGIRCIVEVAGTAESVSGICLSLVSEADDGFPASIFPVPSLCSTIECEQLCLLGPERTAKCGCGEGYELHANGKNCTSNCDSKHIECGGSETKCISMLYLCDGISHCSNHADELKCPPRICLPGQFQCHDNKKCVPPGGLCDDVEDCLDSSDEKFCPPDFRATTSSSRVNELSARHLKFIL
ncbi:hypothetical protein KIN20_012076 [Parelaphostrongylus tenuis]|uniref:Uncharacterized protein n=1 Tax=Parelaphostrongylus tenuis TaxID=148309 RepID=A0AAD5QQA6_PARTN|nr:hypothetical protein KIN20_012076 [Parelaphostrongylus tenuis]